MRKILLSILMIGLMMIMTGCPEGAETGTPLQDPFIGGKDGMVVKFAEDAPPEEVYDGGEYDFGIVIELKNEGETDVAKEDVDVIISGIFASEFGKTEADLKAMPEEDLEGMRKDAEGDIVESNPHYVEFDGLNYAGQLAGSSTFKIRADICYKYTTKALSKMCIRKNNLASDENVCIVTENKDIFSSGAPVQVTEFKENARAKDKVAFTFRISHEGDGSIYTQGSKCNTESRAFEDKVWVEVVTGLDGLKCSGMKDGSDTTGYVTLYGNDKPVTCVQQISTNSNYEKNVDIKLVYDYFDVEETEVLVKHALN